MSFRYGLKGPFFALIMLAFAEIFHMVSLGWGFIGGAEGLLIPLDGNAPLKMQFLDKKAFYFLSLWMVIGSLYLVWRLERTKIGLYFLACREDHDAAEALRCQYLQGTIDCHGAKRRNYINGRYRLRSIPSLH